MEICTDEDLSQALLEMEIAWEIKQRNKKWVYAEMLFKVELLSISLIHNPLLQLANTQPEVLSVAVSAIDESQQLTMCDFKGFT